MMWKPARRVTPRNRAAEASVLVPFVDDDDGYLHWLAAHPDGYVLNMQRSPRPSYLPLHRATCKHISGIHGKSQTGPYTKLCSGDRETLEEWAKADVGGTPKPCGSCKP